MKRILLVEDEERIRSLYTTLLAEEGYQVTEAPDVSSAYAALVSNTYDLVLLDIRLPEIDGNILNELLAFFRIEVKLVVASVYPLDAQKRLVPGAADYFDKSQGVDTLLEKIKKVLS